MTTCQSIAFDYQLHMSPLENIHGGEAQYITIQFTAMVSPANVEQSISQMSVNLMQHQFGYSRAGRHNTVNLHTSVCHDELNIPWTSFNTLDSSQASHSIWTLPSPTLFLLKSINSNTIMSRRLKTTVMAMPRLDLSLNELFQISVYSIYVSPSPTVVASLMNQKWTPKPRLTTQDVRTTYLHLHDTEHDVWVRAKNMNRMEKQLLETILKDCGVEERLWNVDVVRPVGATAGLRLESPTAHEHSSRNGEVQEAITNSARSPHEIQADRGMKADHSTKRFFFSLCKWAFLIRFWDFARVLFLFGDQV